MEKYGTDKAVYASAYELLLRDRRASVRRVLEVGIGTLIAGAHSSMLGYARPHYRQGGSLRAWRDYFPQAIVVGIDVQADTQFAGEPRIRTLLCDSTNETSVQNCLSPYRTTGFDLIVDDGSHDGEDQLGTFANLFPYLDDRGLYVIEDVYEGHSVLYEQPEIVRDVCGSALFFTALFLGAEPEDVRRMIVVGKTAGEGQ